MTKALTALTTCILILAAQQATAQVPLQYREFQLGSDVASIARLIGTAASEAKVIHQRPVLIQSLEWRPRYFTRGVESGDPVQVMVFTFYDNQLFRVAVEYARDRTEGMTDADMVESIAATYGPAMRMLQATTRIPSQTYGVPPEVPIAVWADSTSSITLLRSTYPAVFKLLVSSTHLDNLSQAARSEAARLDAKEAPDRELARQKKESDDAAAALKKSKSENKASFKP